jgi:hypothetical protein
MKFVEGLALASLGDDKAETTLICCMEAKASTVIVAISLRFPLHKSQM